MKKNKNILVDMTCSIIHHGHIRLLKKASFFGKVIVALSRDDDVLKYKKFKPPFNFQRRKEILESIKYVSKVIPCNYYIDDKFLIKNKIDYLVHGEDNRNTVSKKYLKIYKRTPKVSSKKLIKSIRKNLYSIFN